MKTLEQEEINHMNTRKAWDNTIKERDSLKNEVKALSAIKNTLEKQIINFVDLRNEFTTDFGRFILDNHNTVFNNGKSMETVVKEFSNSWNSKNIK